MEVFSAARFDVMHVGIHHYVLGTRRRFHTRAPGTMVPVRMTDEEHLGIGELEAQLLHALADHWNGTFQIAVDQDVALWRRDEISSQPFAADVVNVANHPVGR